MDPTSGMPPIEIATRLVSSASGELELAAKGLKKKFDPDIYVKAVGCGAPV